MSEERVLYPSSVSSETANYLIAWEEADNGCDKLISFGKPVICCAVIYTKATEISS